MAWRWRIRHKLVLGLGLVVAVLALLLAGTLNGLLSYSNTMRSIESKLAECNEADALRLALTTLQAPPESKLSDAQKTADFRDKLAQARIALARYEGQLADTLARGRDPEMGYMEKQLVDACRGSFTKLAAALDDASRPALLAHTASKAIQDDAKVKTATGELVRTSEDLRATLFQELFRYSNEAKGHYRNSMVFVISTCVLSVSLMAGLLRFFYGWVFNPVRDVQQGAGRIARGDFDHRIAVKSGDEMEDLAIAFNDMTDRLSVMYRDLEHQVNERSRQLVRSEHLASVGFLAAGVAHEINNPLASIAFCGEALEGRLASLMRSRIRQDSGEGQSTRVLASATTEDDIETVTKYLQMIQKAAFRCKEITQKLLEFSRCGERKREPADLADVVRGVLDLAQHLPNGKGKHVVFDPAGRLVASVNSQEISSVVLNLVVNALDSMDAGGTLTILLTEREGRAELVFADTGCGMTQEVLDNIFEPFYTRSRTGKGTGLGLSICHRIIAQHAGEIEATSAGPGRGSTFTVRLPLQEQGARSKELGTRNQELETQAVWGQGQSNRKMAA